MATPPSLDSSPLHDHEQGPLLEPGSFIDSLNETTPTKHLETYPKNADMAASETPSWLPQGWKMVTKVRESGATAGLIDRYYVEPTSGCRLRSRKKMEYFLQTRTKRNKTIPPADAAADVQSSASPGVGKRKKSSSGSKNVPEMTSWKPKDVPNDQSMPYSDDKFVSNSIKQGLDPALQSQISGNSKPM